ncbi:MAG: patatin-like phospholipase family protein [Desulfuromonadales bacterium]|nr:patatin-like phospholipase family protein [Desulfuromonadales bacterium]
MNFSSSWKQIRRLWRGTGLPKDGIALALGGGAVLGAAHVGVLKALAEHDVPIRAISGTSIGGLIAALHAFGKRPEEIETLVAELDWLGVTRLTLSRFGILSNDELGKKIEESLGDVDIGEAQIPLYLVATNIASGEKVVLDQGSLPRAVMASSCIPGVFVPVEIDDRLLVDGGLVENVPVSPLRDNGARFVVGVDLNAHRHYQRPEDIVDLLANAIDIAIDNVTRTQVSDADLLIAPELASYSRRDTSRFAELVEEGYQTTCQLLREAGKFRSS